MGSKQAARAGLYSVREAAQAQVATTEPPPAPAHRTSTTACTAGIPKAWCPTAPACHCFSSGCKGGQRQRRGLLVAGSVRQCARPCIPDRSTTNHPLCRGSLCSASSPQLLPSLACTRPSLSGLAAPLTFTTNASSTTVLLHPALAAGSSRQGSALCSSQPCSSPPNPAQNPVVCCAAPVPP